MHPTLKRLTARERTLFSRLNSAVKIQDYLERIPANFETQGATCRSPRKMLACHRAHCLEGAIFAAAVLWYHGHPPLLVDLTSTKDDAYHVIVPFRRFGRWGALSKTNHAVLRYREPVYRDIRELVMSYFHEYSTNNGKKTLRSFTQPLNLRRFASKGWVTSEEDLWYISDALDDLPHIPLLTRSTISSLRRTDPIERTAGKLVQWRRR